MSTLDVRFGTSQLRLKKFNIKDMVDHATVAMIAKRASGKSYVTKEILYHKRSIPAAVVISRTEKLNKFYGDFIPDSYTFNDFEPDILSRIYGRQTKLSEDNENRVKEGKKSKDDRLMLIMDDCMSSKGAWVKDPTILELFFNGRHYHISFILTMQYCIGIPPEMRSNLDYIFLLAEDFISNQKNYMIIMQVCFLRLIFLNKCLLKLHRIMVLWLLIIEFTVQTLQIKCSGIKQKLHPSLN